MKAFRSSVSFFCVVASIVLAQAAAEPAVSLAYKGDNNYILVERTDLLRYDNGKYIGLVSREVQSYISRQASPAGDASRYYDGSFYVVQETKHNQRRVRQGIHDSIASCFKITADGELVMLEDNGYPSFRSFPAYPRQKVSVGDSWQAQGVRAVDPLDSGYITKLPFLVEYTYVRDDVYNEEAVYVVEARWATRYGLSYTDPDGDPALKSAQGKHVATIIISKATGDALVVRDTVDEYFVYQGNQQVRFKGTISLFTRYPPSYNKGNVITALQRVAIVTPEEAGKLSQTTGGSSGGGGTGTGSSKRTGTGSGVGSAVSNQKDISVESTSEGLRLTMQNLQFKPDSAELLPSELGRLDSIAAVLKEAPDAQFLVEGHTASTGNPASEQRLSEQRAHAIAEALVARGIPAEKFICRGSGGRKPIADNKTREGMAKNRRVEITILE